MGICLDTEANSTAPESEETEWKGRGGGGRAERSGTVKTPNSGTMQTANTGKVKFDPPSVPVIFVLGGPGSGKVTHCDTLMEEKRGVTHINMMDLLHQHVISNDMQDFSQLSSKMVTEVLMLEIKMAPAAKAYLISGFPRSMRDVVEYSDKIQIVSGVILISWRQSVLQKQIDYGVKLGQVVLSLAKMELENFYKNVIPVSEYFDQSGLLSVVNGERNPSEVYKDFRTAVLQVLGSQDDRDHRMPFSGRARADSIIAMPGVVVAPEPSNWRELDENVDNDDNDMEAEASESLPMAKNNSTLAIPPNSNVDFLKMPQVVNNNFDVSNLPPIIWVIGGPGSNKSTLCLKAVALNPGWSHFSIGRTVRAIAESDPKANTENHRIKNAIVAGEMIQKQSIDKIIRMHLNDLCDKKGIIIDGYPRDLDQVKDFEQMYQQRPPIVLLDCSKLQLGRGRLDDTVSSFRRRLEQFRELTLPMLKVLDTDGRLAIVDGDTDSSSVQREFERVIRQHTIRLSHETAYRPVLPKSAQNFRQQLQQQQPQKTTQPNGHDDPIIEDLDNMPGSVPTISNHISLIHNNNAGPIEQDNSNNNNNINTDGRSNKNDSNLAKNHATNQTKTFRSMLEEAETHPIDEA